MRVIAFVKITPAEEAQGSMPSTEQLEAVGRFNAELQDAGVLVGAEGLLPSSTGVRVRVAADGVQRTDGPFTDSTDLVAGWWLLDVATSTEAAEWLSRYPAAVGETAEFEIRTVATAEDFGDQLTPDLTEAETHMRDELGAR